MKSELTPRDRRAPRKSESLRPFDANGTIAEIVVEPETREVRHLKLFDDRLRFKCQRCATFCCKLGGPRLTPKDVVQLKKTGLPATEFLDSVNMCLKNTPSGFCVLLEFDSQKQSYQCKVYPHRPDHCRLYPFHFEKVDSKRFLVTLLPCKGINRHRGAIVDERFLTANLTSLILHQ
jgi:Fe-S-cluster containining protein